MYNLILKNNHGEILIFLFSKLNYINRVSFLKHIRIKKAKTQRQKQLYAIRRSENY
jgi:hypothetical protein